MPFSISCTAARPTARRHRDVVITPSSVKYEASSSASMRGHASQNCVTKASRIVRNRGHLVPPVRVEEPHPMLRRLWHFLLM
jgi:hypothetical protein